MCSLRSLRSLALNYSVTKILRKIRATTFTENYGKLRVRGMSAWDERTLPPISLDNVVLYPFFFGLHEANLYNFIEMAIVETLA